MLRRYTLGTVMGLLGLFVLAGCGGILNELERLAPPGTFVSGGSNPMVGTWTQSSLSIASTNQSVSCGSGNSINVNGTLLSCDAINRTYVNTGSFLDNAPTADVGSGTWTTDSSGNLTTIKNGLTTTGPVVVDSSEYQWTVITTINGTSYSILYTWLTG